MYIHGEFASTSGNIIKVEILTRGDRSIVREIGVEEDGILWQDDPVEIKNEMNDTSIICYVIVRLYIYRVHLSSATSTIQLAVTLSSIYAVTGGWCSQDSSSLWHFRKDFAKYGTTWTSTV